MSSLVLFGLYIIHALTDPRTGRQVRIRGNEQGTGNSELELILTWTRFLHWIDGNLGLLWAHLGTFDFLYSATLSILALPQGDPTTIWQLPQTWLWAPTCSVGRHFLPTILRLWSQWIQATTPAPRRRTGGQTETGGRDIILLSPLACPLPFALPCLPCTATSPTHPTFRLSSLGRSRNRTVSPCCCTPACHGLSNMPLFCTQNREHTVRQLGRWDQELGASSLSLLSISSLSLWKKKQTGWEAPWLMPAGFNMLEKAKKRQGPCPLPPSSPSHLFLFLSDRIKVDSVCQWHYSNILHQFSCVVTTNNTFLPV